MRKLAAIGLAVALAVVLTASANAKGGPVGVRYQHLGPVGVLSFAEAQTRHFQALDSLGHIAATGVVPLPYFEIPAVNSGPDKQGIVLWVRVDPDLQFCIGDNQDDWLWE